MRSSEPGFSAVLSGDPERPAIEQFIRSVFHEAYGARVQHFASVLLGIRGADGKWEAALGFTPAAGQALFVENYGGGSVETQLSRRLAVPVRREHIVEVGNLAGSHAGAFRMLIAKTIAFLHQRGYSWAVFTATDRLAGSFSRLDLRPITLARADPARLPDHGRSWGSYYQTKPTIMAGSILLAQLCMNSRSFTQAGAAL